MSLILLPDDILISILSQVDLHTLLYSNIICQSLYMFYKNNLLYILQCRLLNITKFKIAQYNLRQLLYINQILSISNNIQIGFNHRLVIGVGGNLYVFLPDKKLVKIPKLYNICKISLKYNVALALKNNGSVYVFAVTHVQDRPKLISHIPPISDISSGYKHSLLLTNTGLVYALGNNSYGQLGLGDMQDDYIVGLIPNLANIISISAGLYHSLAITVAGQVYGFGNNEFNQLNSGTQEIIFTPTLISSLSSIISISAGSNHSLALSVNRQVYGFGSKKFDDLWLTLNENNPLPNLNNIISIAAGHDQSFFLTAHGKVYILGVLDKYQFFTAPTLISDLPNIISIVTGYNQALAIDVNGGLHYIN